jgi:hypothetical protein
VQVDRIVAVGFLTERDLRMLGDGFRRYAPVPDDDIFRDLLEKLDEVEATPLGRGVTLARTKRR